MPADLFLLGRHRLYVGNARHRKSYLRLMCGEKAQIAILDCPYNVKIRNIGSRGRIKHREFIVGSGELSKGEFVQFLKTSTSLSAEFSVDGAIHYVFMDWRHMGELLAAGEAVYTELKNLC